MVTGLSGITVAIRWKSSDTGLATDCLSGYPLTVSSLTDIVLSEWQHSGIQVAKEW